MVKDRFKKIPLVFRILIIIIIIWLSLILYVEVFQGKHPSPRERNYIVFNNEKIENVVDSLKKLKTMLKNYPFPITDTENNWISISSENGILICGKQKVKISNLDSLRQIDCFKYLSYEQIKIFLSTFSYLCDIGLNWFKYYFDADLLISDYKDYYLYYDSPWFDDDMMRFIVYDSNFNKVDLNLYKLLDSTNNLYLLSFRNAKIMEDDSKYYIRPKHKLKYLVREMFKKYTK